MRTASEVGADTDADALVDMVAGALIYRVLVLAEPVDGRLRATRAGFFVLDAVVADLAA